MDREKIDSACEQGILGLVLGILVFGPLAFGASGTHPWAFLVILAMTLLVMALWTARIWAAPRAKFLVPPVSWAILAFVAYAIVRYVQADIPYPAHWELMRILVYGFLFFAILNNLHRQESKQIIGLTLVFLGMLISFYAAYQFLAKSHKVWNVDNSVYRGRASGTFIYPNNLAGFLELILPLGICYAFAGRLSHVTKIFVIYACFAMAVGIAVTISRGGYAVTGLLLLILCGMLLTQRDYRIQGLALAAVVLVGLAIAIPRMSLMRVRVKSAFLTGQADDLRLALWDAAVRMWRDNFWFGVGPGLFDYRFGKYRLAQVQLRPNYAHNDYLNTLADWGLIGAILVAIIVALLFYGILKSWKAVRGSRDDFSRKKSSKFAFLMGASVGLAAIMIHSLVDFNLQIPAIAILVVTFMALLTSQWRFATERYWYGGGVISKALVTLLLLAGIGYLGVTGSRAAREYYWLQRAAKEDLAENHYRWAQIEALQQALKIDPENPATAYRIGQLYRQKSWNGYDDYIELAHKAMEYYKLGSKLNPYDAMNWVEGGMSVDWSGNHPDGTRDDSSAYYLKANELDGNNYFVTVNTAWHYVQIGDLAAARSWFERSIRLKWVEADNEVAYNYLRIIEQRLRENAERNK